MQHIVGLWEVLAATYIMVQASIRVTRNIPTLKYEWLYLTFLFLYLIPLTSWVPPVFDAYGPERSCCWITSKNWSDCSFFCDWSGPTVCPLLHTSVLVHATGHHPAAAIHHNHAQTIPAVGGQVWTWCFGDKEVHKSWAENPGFLPSCGNAGADYSGGDVHLQLGCERIWFSQSCHVVCHLFCLLVTGNSHCSAVYTWPRDQEEAQP